MQVSGLEELHRLGIVHGDLKPANILLTPTGHLTIADYNCSVRQEDLAARLDHCFGTPGYYAPEMEDPKHLLYEEYVFRVDMWTLGLVLLELYFSLRYVGFSFDAMYTSANCKLALILSRSSHLAAIKKLRM